MQKSREKLLRLVRQIRGMTLLEVMIASMLFSLVSIGVSSYMVFLSRMQSKQNHKFVVATIQQELIRHLIDEKAWDRTINQNTGGAFDCLFPTPPDEMNCQGEGVKQFALYDRNDALVYDPSGIIDGVTKGFNKNGQPCDWNAGASDNLCPYHFDLYWEPLCRHPASVSDTCTNVMAYIRGDFIMAADTNEGESVDALTSSLYNPELYNFWLFRRTGIDVESDTFEATIGGPSGTPGGNCAVAGYQIREGWQQTGVSKFVSIANGDNGSNSQFVFIKKNGDDGATFQCRIVSNAFGVGENQARILVNTGSATFYIGGTAYAPAGTNAYYGSTNYAGSTTQPSGGESVIDFVFRWAYSSSAVRFEVQHWCAIEPVAPFDPAMSLGRPTSSGNDEVHASIRCVRLDANY